MSIDLAGGEVANCPALILIVDLLWNTADKYKDPNEPNKSAE